MTRLGHRHNMLKVIRQLERSREGVDNGLKYITSAYKIDFCENIKDKFL